MTPGRERIDPSGGPEYREPSQAEADALIAGDAARKAGFSCVPDLPGDPTEGDLLAAVLSADFHAAG